MSRRQILVEIDPVEAEYLALKLRRMHAEEWEVNPQRLADRFEIAATTKDEPAPMMGRAIVISRVMS